MMSEMNLGDVPSIPDLSGIMDDGGQATQWADGWYAGTIMERREFTDSTGSERGFESGDEPSASGAGRNVRLQVEVKRQDGRTLNISTLVNYQTDDLSQETVQAITAKQAGSNGKTQWGELFRPFMALQRLGKLQRIAGVRQLQRNPSSGGLDLTPLYGKAGYFKLGPDRRNPLYREVKDFTAAVGPKTKVL